MPKQNLSACSAVFCKYVTGPYLILRSFQYLNEVKQTKNSMNERRKTQGENVAHISLDIVEYVIIYLFIGVC